MLNLGIYILFGSLPAKVTVIHKIDEKGTIGVLNNWYTINCLFSNSSYCGFLWDSTPPRVLM